MKPFLAFDCETSSLPNFSKPSDDPSQPHVLQLAWAIHDETGRVVQACSSVVAADCDIDPKAQETHGLSREHCSKWGIAPHEALRPFANAVKFVDVLVAHSMNFDRRLIEAMTHRHGTGHEHLLTLRETKTLGCTMMDNLNIVCAPFPNPATLDGRGRNGAWKFPSLAETLKFYGLPPQVEPHDALADTLSCAAIWKKMQAPQ